VAAQFACWVTGWVMGGATVVTVVVGALVAGCERFLVFNGLTFTSPGPTALTTTALDLSTMTGAWLPSVKTTTARRLCGLLNTTRGPSTSTSAP
jgi:hypothetical protein